jgi:hypothetical protein
MKLTIVHVGDNFEQSGVWINGEYSGDGTFASSDCFGLMAEYIKRLTKKGPLTIEDVEYVRYELHELTCNDIPDYITDTESLESWHLEETGEVLERCSIFL